MAQPLLQVMDLCTYFHTPYGVARAVDGVSFTVNPGETVGIVGESGCGKSMTALSILQLVPEPAGYIAGGRILFEGSDLLDLSWSQMRNLRGKDIAMIFQEPMTSLNAVFTVGWQMKEIMQVHGTAEGEEAYKRAVELLDHVRIPNAAQIMRQYPHELSGGMRQRVMIAMALANKPKLLIADEPTTALDVTVQAQILELMRDLQAEMGMAILLITHDLGIVAKMASQVVVMYAGQVVENAPSRVLYRNPQHPYTRGLFASLPSRNQRGHDLHTLEGTVPQATNWPPACRFEPRCAYRWGSCAKVMPRAIETEPGHIARCHLYDANIADRPEGATEGRNGTEPAAVQAGSPVRSVEAPS
ncbi:MAG TPA: ABC transporter ATP-binding protein [Chthonomonadaceae bacterium]|nr:ABC transporter ATP-binding protein [Chthonomonadaceae bacterium]